MYFVVLNIRIIRIVCFRLLIKRRFKYCTCIIKTSIFRFIEHRKINTTSMAFFWESYFRFDFLHNDNLNISKKFSFIILVYGSLVYVPSYAICRIKMWQRTLQSGQEEKIKINTIYWLFYNFDEKNMTSTDWVIFYQFWK